MREIKFRAWIPERKKMFQVGNLVIPKGLNEFGDQELGVSETYSIIKPHHYIQPVLMQYTGLKDCKVKEIYEGDIVQITCGCGYQENLPVEWKDNHNGYFARAKWQHDWDNNQLDMTWTEKDCEIIGNIYENPELLKEIKYDR